MWRNPMPTVLIAGLIVWIAWNLANFTVLGRDGRPDVYFPAAAHRSGYDEYIASFPPSKVDFVVYEAVKRYFRGGHLIGFEPDALVFGDHAFHGPSRQSVANYDPNLTEAETRALVERARVLRVSASGVSAVVVVAPDQIPTGGAALVLRGSDGSRFFVAASMAPSRYSGVANGR